jgi:hypothetical protein
MPSGGFGLPPGLPLRPGNQCPRSSRSTRKLLPLRAIAHVDGTIILPKAKHRENWRVASISEFKTIDRA